MKKILCITLSLLLILPMLLLPASAAEYEEFTLYPYQVAVPMSDDFVSVDSVSQFYYYEGLLPTGYYQFYVFREDDPLEYITSVVYLDIDSLVGSVSYGSSDWARLDCTFLNSDKFTYCTVYLKEISGSFYTCIAIANAYPGSRPALARYFGDTPPSASAFDGLSIDGSALIQHIVSLLPIVIPVVVCFIGIRKAIRFVRNKVNGA